MSRLFRDRLLVSLAPESVALARFGRAPRRRIVDKRVLACDPGLGAEPWRGAVSALAQAAAELRKWRVDVSVVLSNHFVRYAVFARNEALGRGDEELAFARHRFARIHGERASDWEVRLSAGSARAARLACAVDRGLLEALRACLPPGGRARLVSVQPYLMAAFNRWRGTLGGAATWLLLLEARRACVARLEHGQLTEVRNLRGEFDAPARWVELLERERRLAAADEPRPAALIHAPLHSGGETLELAPWRLRIFGGPAPRGIVPVEDAALAMALCAI